jgi:hypothetical protein
MLQLLVWLRIGQKQKTGVPNNQPVQPNVIVEWLTLVLSMRDVPCQTWAQRPAIMTEIFRGYPQSFQTDVGIVH